MVQYDNKEIYRFKILKYDLIRLIEVRVEYFHESAAVILKGSSQGREVAFQPSSRPSVVFTSPFDDVSEDNTGKEGSRAIPQYDE